MKKHEKGQKDLPSKTPFPEVKSSRLAVAHSQLAIVHSAPLLETSGVACRCTSGTVLIQKWSAEMHCFGHFSVLGDFSSWGNFLKLYRNPKIMNPQAISPSKLRETMKSTYMYET